MKKTSATDQEELGYLFNVEILVKEQTNAKALQKLLQLLNSSDDIIDYRINSGIELGAIINSMLANKKQSLINKSYKRINEGASNPTPSETKDTKTPHAPKEQPESPQQNSFVSMAKSQYFENWVQKYIAENSLVRLLVNRNGKRVSIPCRILNFLTDTYTMTVYHVDEKQVYSFHLSEIIDLNE
ncbi:hypothetical protein M3201_03750 [Paenibacillus motobuensis]|uniref:hypothetical protein n=1 Tax=Paenibacillus TaxID=44249 RepID=UPI00203EE883|nr:MULTISPECIES: hypothetical protein [Paenibacillus]MCM3038814.1 hypothetical protein [Paenibacillus lutimineralis]MCM3645918.1 hypothetical protein [Paenibacillus motobuensis]